MQNWLSPARGSPGRFSQGPPGSPLPAPGHGHPVELVEHVDLVGAYPHCCIPVQNGSFVTAQCVSEDRGKVHRHS